MKTNIIKQIGKVLPIFAALAVATVALGEDAKKNETMCVKQKDGSYLCKASGQKMDKPCCSTPDNGSKETPKPKQS
jgi:hypothetical protein